MVQSSIAAPDGTRIDYTVEGTGPALVLTNGLTTTSTFWKYLRPRWLARHQVITWDYPGHGSSAPACSEAGARIAAQPAIVARIMDAAGIERATHVGFSVGCQVVLETYRELPERCDALITLLGAAGRVLETLEPPLNGAWLARLLTHAPERAFAAAFRALVRNAWNPLTPIAARRLGLVGPRLSAFDLREIVEHLRSLDPHTLRVMTLSAAEHSAFDVLADIRVPHLIVAGHADPFAPARTVGIPMHRLSRGSELVELPNGTHTSLLEHADVIADVVDRFLARHAR